MSRCDSVGSTDIRTSVPVAYWSAAFALIKQSTVLLALHLLLGNDMVLNPGVPPPHRDRARPAFEEGIAVCSRHIYVVNSGRHQRK